MHKIGVISDTHGMLRGEVEETLRGCEAILHGGDINSPEILSALRGIAPTYVVRGNNDKEWAADLPETLSIELYGVHFFMVHNKKYLPKDAGGIDVVIYGHSHKYEERRIDGRLYLNPGSCGPGRFSQPVTFALLEIEDGRLLGVEKIEIARQAKKSKDGPKQPKGRSLRGAGGRDDACDSREDAGADPVCELAGLDMQKLVRAVMQDTDKKLPVDKIAARNGISEELADQICRLYLTHPGVSVEGILGKMGL